jgi:glucokinase
MLMRQGKFYLVFDIGGTSIRTGLYNEEHRRLERFRKTCTPNFMSQETASADAIVERMLEVLKEEADALCGECQPAGVCAALPSPMAPDGTLWRMPTVLGPRDKGGFRLQDKLQALWPEVPVAMLNDVSAAGYYRVAQGGRDFAIVTIGSGIGLKVFLDAKPRTGPNGRGGEIGHFSIEEPIAGDLACDCGGSLHLGAVASGRGTLRVARQMAAADPAAYGNSLAARLARDTCGCLSNDVLVAAFRDDDPWARQVMTVSASHLARALAFLHLSLGLEEIVLVGGFAGACGEKYRELTAKLAGRYAWDTGQDWNAIIRIESQPDTVALEGAGHFMATRPVQRRREVQHA